MSAYCQTGASQSGLIANTVPAACTPDHVIEPAAGSDRDVEIGRDGPPGDTDLSCVWHPSGVGHLACASDLGAQDVAKLVELVQFVRRDALADADHHIRRAERLQRVLLVSAVHPNPSPWCHHDSRLLCHVLARSRCRHDAGSNGRHLCVRCRGDSSDQLTTERGLPRHDAPVDHFDIRSVSRQSRPDGSGNARRNLPAVCGRAREDRPRRHRHSPNRRDHGQCHIFLSVATDDPHQVIDSPGTGLDHAQVVRGQKDR